MWGAFSVQVATHDGGMFWLEAQTERHRKVWTHRWAAVVRSCAILPGSNWGAENV